jgi:hypothetical protein
MKTMIRNCRIKKRCDRTWDQLSESSPTGLLKKLRIETVRYCDKCRDFVWWCDTGKELADAVTRNQCVAFVNWHGALGGQENQVFLGSIKIHD